MRAIESRTRQAEQLATDLATIRRRLRDSVTAKAHRFKVPLTAAQLSALEVLVEEERATGAGLSLSTLSARMGLSHSTVSGIASRLAQRDLVRRSTPLDDRRYTLIELAPAVKGWLSAELPSARVEPLADALRRATRDERRSIVAGLAALARLLTEGAD